MTPPPEPRRAARRRAALVALALPFLLAACGGSDDGTTTTSAADQTAAWANGLCTSLADWRSAVTSAAGDVKDNISKAGVQSAADDVTAANAALRDDLAGLGKPPTPTAAEARSSVDSLTTKLESQAGTIEDAVGGVSNVAEAATAASTVGASLAAMQADLSATAQHLKSLRGDSEWQQAFSDSQACNDLTA